MGKRKRFLLDVDQWVGGTASMTAAERGAYISLLCAQWVDGPLSESQAMAAGRADIDTVRRVLERKFTRLLDGTFQNDRLERERSRVSSKAGSGKKRPEAGQTDLTLYRSILEFPCNGEQKTWILTDKQLSEWAGLYPGLDVLGECRKALAWVLANERKTARGMPKFLVSWLNRVNDKGSGAGATAKSFKQADREDRQRMLARIKAEQARGIFEQQGGGFLDGPR